MRLCHLISIGSVAYDIFQIHSHAANSHFISKLAVAVALKQRHVVQPAAPRQDIRVRVVLVVFDVKWVRHRARLFVAYGGVEKVCQKCDMRPRKSMFKNAPSTLKGGHHSRLRSHSHPHLVAAANQPGRFDGFGTFCISKIPFFVWVAHRQPEQDSVRLSGAAGISAQFRHRSVAVANPNT